MKVLSEIPLILNERQLKDLIPLLFLIPGGVSVALDPECKRIMHNPTASEFLRINVGENFSMSADAKPNVRAYDEHGRELAASELSLQRAVAEAQENRQIVELEWPDGVRRIAIWNSKPIWGADGRVVGAVSISEDITSYVLEERRSRSEQVQLRVEIEKLDRLKHVSHLAAGISHEVRNPLTTVKGFLQVMRAKEKYAEDTQVLDMLVEELNRANDIISDFLSLTKVQEKQLVRGNLVNVIDRLSPLLESDAFLSRKNLVIRRNPVADILLYSKEIKQLILNLVRNAMEATPAGGSVRIETFQTSRSVGITVADEGPGIPREIVEKLGTPFLTTKSNGTGVGLAICYDIAQRHRAVIDVETGSRGTVFKVASPPLPA